MVVGNGLLANAFSQFEDDDTVVLFASGVSNSTLENKTEYEREYKLVEKYSTSNSLFIYFSTCSVFDKTLAKTPYILHKLKLEKFIQEKLNSYLIFRLPILVGKTPNANTLTNFLFNCISQNKTFSLHKNACRYIMDVDDVKILLAPIIKSNSYSNKIINVHFGNQIFIAELVEMLEQSIKEKAIYTIEEKGDCYITDNRIFSSVLKEHGFQLPINYNKKIIEKYYGKKN